MSAPADLQGLKIDRGPRAVPRRRARLPVLPAVVLLLVAGAAWLLWPAIRPLLDRLRLPTVQSLLVSETSPVDAAAVSGTAANGHVVASRRAALSSDVSGRIVEMRVTEGSVVKKGDVVARLYSDEFRAALERAQADLATAEATVLRAGSSRQAAEDGAREAKANEETQKARFDEAQAQEVWAKQEFERQEELVRQQIRSSQDLQRARSDLDAASARVVAAAAAQRSSGAAAATAHSRVKVAEGDLAVAQKQKESSAAAVRQASAALDKMDVRAPFDGIVVLKDAEVGEVVSPFSQGGSNARGAVCTMVDFDSLEVQANVAETSLGSVAVGAPVDCYLDALPQKRYPGVVDRIWPTADRQKATIEVRIKLLERDDLLRPEMAARVVFREGGAADLSAASGPPAILLPETAFVLIGGKDGAFVLERDVARFQPVQLGERKLGRVVVTSGLRPGQRIVANPPPSLQDGDRVLVQDG